MSKAESMGPPPKKGSMLKDVPKKDAPVHQNKGKGKADDV